MKNIEHTKSTCEKHTLRFNGGMDYAVFTIDDTGIFQCHSSFGDFAYRWSSFGEDFKKFLCRIDSHYLINKVAKEDYFDFYDYQEKVKLEIIKERRDYELNKEDARELWNFFENELDDYSNSYDLTCFEVFDNDKLNELCGGEVFFSEFCPEKDYSPSAKIFAFEIFPMFINILKEEVVKSNG